MIARFAMLIRRELWEHRALFIAPATIAGLILLAVAIMMLTSGMIRGIGFETLVAGISASGEHGRATGFGALILMPVIFLNIGLILTVFFYCLDALYAERKDRSILFWRSLPITDTETVLSKLAVAAVAAPVIAFLVLALTQLGIMALSTIFVWLGGGSAWELVWGPVPLIRTWALSLFSLLAGGLWALPFLAWFLFCSAYVKKSPFLWAVLPFAVVPLLERLAFGTSYFFRFVFGHLGQFVSNSFEIDGGGHEVSIDSNLELTGGRFNPVDFMDPVSSFTAPELWVGCAVAAGLAAATIYVRRYRPDVAS